MSRITTHIGNQTVLLRGVNDCVHVIKELMYGLINIRVRPYYIYQCDLSQGLRHFRTPVSKGIEIIESLKGHISGFAVPTFVVDAPGGGGKIPVMPNQYTSRCQCDVCTGKTKKKKSIGVSALLNNLQLTLEPKEQKDKENQKNHIA